MANEVDILLVKYASDISQLQSSTTSVEAEFRKVAAAGEASSKAIEQTLNKQAALVDNMVKRLSTLATARDKSQGDPARVERINALIATQQERLEEIRGVPPLQIISPTQLGIIEQARKSLQELTVARDTANKAIRKLTELPPATIIDPAQLGLIEQARNNIEQLTIARDKAQDTTTQEALNKAIGQQRDLLEQMTTIPPVTIIDPSQIGLIENAKNRLTQLTAARDKANDPTKIVRLNGLIQQQESRLKSLQGTKPPEALDPNKNNILAKSFESLATKIAAVFAVDAVIRFGNEAVLAFGKAQASATQLLGALNGNELAQQRLIAFSKDFSQRFAIPDDVINSQSAFLAIQGRTEEQIKKTIEAAIQLSAVIPGQDLAASVSQLSATFEGNIGRLGKLDKAFDTLSNEQKENGAAVDLILEKYKGFAEKGLEGVLGQLKRTQIETAQTTQEFGKQIAPLEIFIAQFKSAYLQGLAGIFTGAKALFDKNQSIFLNPFNIFRKGTTDEQDAQKVKDEIDAQTAFSLKAFSGANKEILNQQIKADQDLLDLNEKGFRKDSESKKLFYRARIIALNDLLGQIQKAEEGAAQKRIETEASVQLKIQNLQSDLSKVENPRTTGKVRADALRKQIEEQKIILDEIQGVEFQKRKAASERLKELDKKINDDLLKQRSTNALILLDAEKKVQEKELKETFNNSLKTLADRKNLNDGILKLNQEFAIKERQQRLKNIQDAAKDNEEQAATRLSEIQTDFEKIKAQIDSQQLSTEGKVNIDFTNTGDFSAEAEKKLQQDLFNIQAEFDKKRIEAERIFVNDFIKEENRIIQSIKDNADAQKNNVSVQFFAEGDFSDIAFIEFQTKIQKIDQDTNKAIQAHAKESADVKNSLGKDITEAELNESKKRQEIARDEAQKRVAIEKEIRDTIISGVIDTLSESSKLLSERRIQDAENVRDAELKSIDELLAANQKARDKGVLGRKEFEATNKELLEERKRAEEKSAADIKKIKRQQFQNDQIAAISQVIIANIVNAAEFPALALLYAALAAAQTAIILARPNPYKFGTKDAPRHDGLSMVGEEGRELLYMPQHSKVLPHGKTTEKKNAELIDAMFDGDVDKHIKKRYVDPALQEQINKLNRTNAEIYKSLDNSELQSILNGLQISSRLNVAANQYRIGQNNEFATTIANTFMLSNNGMTIRDAEKIRRRGMSVNLSPKDKDDIAKKLAESIPQSTKRRYS